MGNHCPQFQLQYEKGFLCGQGDLEIEAGFKELLIKRIKRVLSIYFILSCCRDIIYSQTEPMYASSSPLWLQEQEVNYGWHDSVEPSALIMLTKSLTQNIKNTVQSFASLKLKHWKHFFFNICLIFFQKFIIVPVPCVQFSSAGMNCIMI